LRAAAATAAVTTVVMVTTAAASAATAAAIATIASTLAATARIAVTGHRRIVLTADQGDSHHREENRDAKSECTIHPNSSTKNKRQVPYVRRSTTCRHGSKNARVTATAVSRGKKPKLFELLLKYQKRHVSDCPATKLCRLHASCSDTQVRTVKVALRVLLSSIKPIMCNCYVTGRICVECVDCLTIVDSVFSRCEIKTKKAGTWPAF
jgi:hypothetical protein